jgi:hypothetical protein
MTTETKEFSTPVLASLTGHKLMAESFSEVHEAAEFVVGHPIWTHEFADKSNVKAIRSAVLEQHPDLSEFDDSNVTPDNVAQRRQELIDEYGETRVLTKGDKRRLKHPIQTLTEIVAESK